MNIRRASILSLIAFACAVASAQPDSVFVTGSGDSVKVWDTFVRENCASRFAFSIVMKDTNTFAITERDTVVQKARCICTYDLFILLPGVIHPGTHHVEVYREYLKQFGYPVDTTVLIGSTSFTTGAQQYFQSAFLYQSSCYSPVSIGESGARSPSGFWLDQCYPDPFNPSTTIRYGIPCRSNLTLKIFNALGQQIATLVDGTREAGIHEVRLDGTGLPSGAYYYRLESGKYMETRRLVILR